MKKNIVESLYPMLPNDFFETLSMFFGYQMIDKVKDLYEDIEKFIIDNQFKYYKTKDLSIFIMPKAKAHIHHQDIGLYVIYKEKFYFFNYAQKQTKDINFNLLKNYVFDKIQQYDSENNNYSENNDEENDNSKNNKENNIGLYRWNDFKNNIIQLLNLTIKEKIHNIIEEIKVPFSLYNIEGKKAEVFINRDEFWILQHDYVASIDLEKLSKEESQLYFNRQKKFNNVKKGQKIYEIKTLKELKVIELTYISTYIINMISNIYENTYKDFFKNLEKSFNKEILDIVRDKNGNFSSVLYNWILADNDLSKMIRRRQAVISQKSFIEYIVNKNDYYKKSISNIIDFEKNLIDEIKVLFENISTKTVKSLMSCKDKEVLRFIDIEKIKEINDEFIPMANNDSDITWNMFESFIDKIYMIKRSHPQFLLFSKSINEILGQTDKEWLSKKNEKSFLDKVTNLYHVDDYIGLISDVFIKGYIFNKYPETYESRIKKFEVKNKSNDFDTKILNQFSDIKDLLKALKNYDNADVFDYINQQKEIYIIEWETLCNKKEIDNIVFTPINNSKDLIGEGKKLEHCVGNYVYDCERYYSFIFSVQNKENIKDISTVEFQIRKDKFVLIQNRSFKNSEPSQEIKDATDIFLEYLNSLKIPEVISNKIEENSFKDYRVYDFSNQELSKKIFDNYKKLLPNSEETETIEEWIKKIKIDTYLDDFFEIKQKNLLTKI